MKGYFLKSGFQFSHEYPRKTVLTGLNFLNVMQSNDSGNKTFAAQVCIFRSHRRLGIVGRVCDASDANLRWEVLIRECPKARCKFIWYMQ